jgi:hypothetical protein
MSDSSIKYGALVLLISVGSILLPKPNLMATHHSPPEVVEQFRPITVDLHQEDEMVKHWGVRVRG